MRFLFVLVVLAVAAYFFPQVYEETGGPCQAIEKKVLRVNSGENAQKTVVAGIALSVSNGELGAQIAADNYPDLPRELACVVTYYDFPEDLRF